MSNKKIIIWNCPALYGIDDGFLCSDNNDEDEKYCYDCTDCVVKQIVEQCTNAQSECSCKNAIKDVDCFECTSGGRAELGTDILQLLQIEVLDET